METSYFRPPDEAHESPEDMEPWGRLALEAALRAAKAKAARKAKAKTKGKVRGKPKVEATAKPKEARPKAPAAKARSNVKASPRRPRR
jgi:DNA transformation protein